MTDDFEKELLAVFRDEVAGALDEILGLLDGWSSAPDRDAQRRLDAAFRTAHNVKGAARLAGFASVESLAHALEEALDRHRKAKTRPPDALLADLEIGMTMMVAFLEGEDLGPTMGQLESRLVSGLGPSQPGSEEAPGEPSEPARPPMGAFEVEPAIAAEAEAEAEIELEAGEAAAETQLGSGASAERSAERIGQAAPEMIRVHSAQLDRLMASSGDLLSHHARHTVRHGALESVGDGLQEALLRLAPEARRDFEAIGARLDTLIREDTNELQRLGYLTGELGDAVKSLRMLPLAGFVAQWRRIAVDAAR
ncbi:MAG: Hpt domain-containing protein, partial [Myxococcales bacterium]|nr:Hpt domain-containing protein [Myxococcales bacterium]